ncbi:MAG: HEAT repeat domain-containing protein [Leptospiraceae bacterium]|nr:HEAT repeat domain-containing protein [Leptospiraceae bacterium]
MLKDKDVSDEMYQQLRREFSNHANGEEFLLEKIADEQDEIVQGDLLHILGTYKYRRHRCLKRTAEFARQFIASQSVYLRKKGIIVLGWIGEKSDVEIIAEAMFNDENEENRGWAATGLMQLFFHKPAIKNQCLRNLQAALATEKSYFTLSCILISIQEIAGKQWGISSTGRPEREPERSIDMAKPEAISFLERYFEQMPQADK